MNEDGDFIKLRRFSLAMGIIFLVYSFGGIELEEKVEMALFGLTLHIRRPWILDLGLFVASIYGISKYFHHAMVKAVSPGKMRKLISSHGLTYTHLEKFSDAHEPTEHTPYPNFEIEPPGGMDSYSDEFIQKMMTWARALVSRYFPHICEYGIIIYGKEAKIRGFSQEIRWKRMGLKLPPRWWITSWKTRLITWMEDLEYTLPIWVNGLAISCYFYFSLFLDKASPASLTALIP